MPNLSGPLRLFLAKTYEILSRKRPAKFIRRFQAILISFTLVVVAVVITYPIWNEASPDLRVGGAFDKDKVAPETVLARVDVEFPRLDLYEENKRAAEAAVPFRFERNFSIIAGQEGKTLATMLADDVTALKACREKAKNEPAFLVCARAIPGFSRLRDVRTLVYLPKIAAKGTEAAIALQEHLLILDKLPEDIQPEAAAVEVRDSGPGKPDTWRALPVESIVLRSQFSQEKTRNLMREVLAQAIPDPYMRSSYLDWILPYIATLEVARYMPEETALARKEAVARLDIPHMRIAAGEPIVKQGDVIRQENRTALEVHARLHLREKAKRITAITLQHFLLLMILVFFAYRFESKRMSDMSANIIFFMNIWIFCGMLFAIETLWHEPNINPEDHIFGSWVPIGIFAVLFSLLSGELFALATAVYLSLLVFGVSQYDPQSFLHSLVMSVMAVWAGTRIRKRIHFLAASIFLMLLAGVLVTMGYLYLNRVIISQSGGDLLTTGYKSAMVKALLMGAATAFTIVILPLYESVFNVPTRFRLQELSDPSTPLLQEFYRLAPST
ncbi:MAG TPA: hypothetical protein PKA91_14530, partial [Leptospiraceae bacterium]|nr:hypothetical protein [Leptospiraceae bacterium]